MMKDVNFSIYESQVPGLEETALESTLYLSWLSEKDSGSYWCRAENRLGKIDMTMGYTLTVQGQGLPEIGKLHACHMCVQVSCASVHRIRHKRALAE